MRYIFPLIFPSVVREEKLELNDSRPGQAEEERQGGKGENGINKGRTSFAKASSRFFISFRLLLLDLMTISIFLGAHRAS
jgi:hypothetical protein